MKAATAPAWTSERLRGRPFGGWRRAGALPRWAAVLVSICAPVLIFAGFLVVVRVNPLHAYAAMLQSADSAYGVGEVASIGAAYALAALAVSVPAQTGLINVGGEGQLAMGALASAWVGVTLARGLPGWVALPAVVAAGLAGGALWCAVAAFLRVRFRVNETISTLMLNYVAELFVAYNVHGPLKDPTSFNWPTSPTLPSAARFPPLWAGTQLHFGELLPVAAAVGLAYLLPRTAWGFRLRVVGGNAEAARRAGMNVPRLLLGAMLLGGALAGLAGTVLVSGVEGQLSAATGVGYGYVGFLAAWLAGQRPYWILPAAALLALITVSGNALQISAALPSSSVNILTAVILVVALARVGRRPA